MKAHHSPDHDDIHMRYTLSAPTKAEIAQFFTSKDVKEGEKNHLEINVDDPSISSQIQQFKDISWSVKIPVKPPLKPMDYTGFDHLLFQIFSFSIFPFSIFSLFDLFLFDFAYIYSW